MSNQSNILTLGPFTPRVPKWKATEVYEQKVKEYGWTPDQAQPGYDYLDRKYREQAEEERHWKNRQRAEVRERREKRR